VVSNAVEGMIETRAVDVAVIGGGFAGLSAACRLADAGARVLVLEARPQLGGRATAFVDRETGELVDNGQHVLFGCYRATFEFLRRIDAESNVRRQASLELPCYDIGGVRSVLKCPRLPAPIHLLAGVLAWDPIPWNERLAAIRLVPPLLQARRQLRLGRPVDAGSQNETVHQWLLRHRQGKVLSAWLWEPLAVAALNQSVHDAAAAPFVRVLAEMFAPDPGAAAIVIPTRPLHEMYAEPARRYITARGGEVRTSALARVIVEDARIAAVEVRGVRVLVSTVLSAVAWHAFGNLFAPDPPGILAGTLASAAAMQPEPIVTVNLWYDREIMPEPFAGLPGRTMQWVFDKRLAFGGSASHLSLVSSGATEIASRSNGELTTLAAQEVTSSLPGGPGARLIRATVIREKRATFSLAPGQPTRPGPTTPVNGLYLAGDWTDTSLPATIEGAVISGDAAARAILASSAL
jgi:squalene-associated FAD-dependent desaturase